MLNCIVAVERNQGIGYNGQMPWPHLKGDMKWFREKTIDSIVIMGRKTWDSIGRKPLSNRINLVLSKSLVEGCKMSSSDPNWLLDYCKVFYPNKQIYIMGGGTVYQQYLKVIDRFYITEIDADFECDTFFNLNYVQDNFTNIIEHSIIEESVKYTIKEYTK